MQQICTFRIGTEYFGVDILLVREISKFQEITPVPGAKDFHYGLMNLRGHVITIIHPSIFVNDVKDVNREEDRLIIFKNDELVHGLIDKKLIDPKTMGPDFIGLIISGVTDVIDIDPSKDILVPSPNLPEKVRSICDGIIRREKHVITLLNMPSLVKNLLV
jgi:chemotaxis signal transduction protein